MLHLIQSIGHKIPIQNLLKITEALKNRYPNLLTQLVKIVLERADAAVVEGFPIEQPHLFDLVCDFGSEEDGRALMKKIFQFQNLPQDKLSSFMVRLKVCTLHMHIRYISDMIVCRLKGTNRKYFGIFKFMKRKQPISSISIFFLIIGKIVTSTSHPAK